MAGNHLENLVAEWYQFKGYFVRQNVQVGKRPRGGYQCELDIVAFHPEQRHLVHVEPSLDANSWTVRERRYKKKFDAGRRFIPGLFPGIDLPQEPEQIALFFFGGKGSREMIGGGQIMFVKEFMKEIRKSLLGRRLAVAAIPEQYPLLRTLQYASEYWIEKKK